MTTNAVPQQEGRGPCDAALCRSIRPSAARADTWVRESVAAGVIFAGMWRDLWQYVRTFGKHWVRFVAAPTVTVAFLVWQVFRSANIPAWAFWLVAGLGVFIAGFLAWREEHARGHADGRVAADLRIFDKAKPLRRTLAASLELWPGREPQSLEELELWGRRFRNSQDVTEPGLKELVDLRPDASPTVKRAVGAARDAYYAAADIVNPLVGATYSRPLAVGEAVALPQLRTALAHLRQSLTALDKLSGGDEVISPEPSP